MKSFIKRLGFVMVEVVRGSLIVVLAPIIARLISATDSWRKIERRR